MTTKKPTIRVLRDFLAVQEIVSPEQQNSPVIIIRNDTNSKLKKATVVAVGSGVLLGSGVSHKIEVEVGEVIIFDPCNAIEVVNKGEKYFILNELSIRAVCVKD